MTKQKYELKIESLNPKAMLRVPTVQTYDKVTSISLEKVQKALILTADKNAPRFPINQSPVSDNKIYKDNSGRQYYRPNFRLATRAGQIPGPAVRFLKDADDKVRLHLEMEEIPSGFEDAQPFALHIEGLAVVWPGGRQAFPNPTIFYDAEASGDRPRITIRAGTEIPTSLVEPLYQAMQKQATLELSLSYGYWIQELSTRPRPVPVKPIVHPLPAVLHPAVRSSLSPGLQNLKLARALSKPVLNLKAANLATSIDASKLAELQKELVAREKKQNYKKATINRKLNFVFDADLKQNLPIYTILKAGEESLQSDWIDTQFGFIRQATFANTVYRLPDELRLAFNPELGLPHLIPQLYRNADEAVRVRVTLRAIPYHNPEKLSALRDFLYRDSAGGLANPSIIIGGYERASLRLLTAFPEEISFMGDSEVEIALEGGIQMTLDLSLEYYRYMAELMTTAIGIEGEVTITLPPGQNEDEGLVKRIPMRLVLDSLAGIELATAAVEETLSPTTLALSNSTNATIQVENYVSRLLQVDSNSVVPLAIFEAANKTPVPIVLKPNEEITVEIDSTGLQDEVWNAMHLALLNPRLTQNATDVLESIHEVAPSG